MPRAVRPWLTALRAYSIAGRVSTPRTPVTDLAELGELAGSIKESSSSAKTYQFAPACRCGSNHNQQTDPRRRGGTTPYLGENVVREKAYLSAMAAVLLESLKDWLGDLRAVVLMAESAWLKGEDWGGGWTRLLLTIWKAGSSRCGRPQASVKGARQAAGFDPLRFSGTPPVWRSNQPRTDHPLVTASSVGQLLNRSCSFY